MKNIIIARKLAADSEAASGRPPNFNFTLEHVPDSGDPFDVQADTPTEESGTVVSSSSPKAAPLATVSSDERAAANTVVCSVLPRVACEPPMARTTTEVAWSRTK